MDNLSLQATPLRTAIDYKVSSLLHCNGERSSPTSIQGKVELTAKVQGWGLRWVGVGGSGWKISEKKRRVRRVSPYWGESHDDKTSPGGC